MINDHWARGNAARVVSKCIVSIALMTTVLTFGLQSAAPATGSIALVAGSTSSKSVATTGAVTVTGAQNVASSANVLLVMVQVFGPNSVAVGTISDTDTGTWTALGETTVSGDTQFVLWQCTNPQAGVKHAVTWTPSAADDWGSLSVMAEWTGGPFTLDKTASLLTSKGTTGATPSVTPSSAGELILASAADENGSSAWTTPTNSFTSLTTPSSANVMAYLVDSATSSISTSWKVSPSDSGVTAIFALSPGTAATSYTVTFSGNGSTGGSMANQTASSPTNLTPNAFTRSGYTFAGWNTSSTGSGTSYADGASYPFNASTTLYAQWTATTSYTVTFSGNGSTGGSMANQTASAPTNLTPNAFTRSGYTFAGWNTSSTGSGTSYADGASYPFNASTTLYAQWTATTSYTVTFSGNGSTGGSMANQTASSPTNLTPNAFTRSGYTFAGWNTSSTGSGTSYADGASYPFNASTTLYAQWTATTSYTVTFSGNGSTGGSMANQTASSPTNLTPNAFTRSGYTFAGWNTSSTGSGTSYANDASYPFNASTTLYAQWTQSTGSIALVAGSTSSKSVATTGAVTVTGAQNVASSANVLLVMVQVFGPNSVAVGTISDTDTGTWTALGETTVSGDTQFVLWQCTNPQAGVKHAVTWTPSAADDWGSLSVMAEWTGGPFTLDKTASLLTSKGTTGATPSVTPSSAGELILASAADENGSSAWTTPTNSFTSLTTPSSANVMAYLVDSATSSISTSWKVSPSDSGVTAIFALSPGTAATSYTVTFSGNGSTGGSMANQTASSPTNLTPNAFTRSGYTFAGWNTSSTGSGTSYADGASYPFNASTTLYAQWTATTSYTVTFSGNGSTGGSMANQTASSPTNLTPNAFTRSGYTFAGWNTSSTGSGTSYADGASYPFNASTTLYAQWTATTSYTVTFSGNGSTGGSMANQTASSPTNLTPNAFTRSGYTFAGWNTSSTGSGTSYADGASYPFNASTTLYAQWTATTSYTVTFSGNGSTGGSMANQTASSPTNLTPNAFTRSGYTFAGWNTSSTGSGTSYANDASYPFNASTTLYAQWTQSTNLAAVGNFVTTGGFGTTTANATLSKSGDLLVIWVKNRLVSGSPIQVISISASGTGAIGTPVDAIQYNTVDHPNNDDEIWYAPVTTAGTITLTFTWSGANSSDYSEYSTQEFQPSTPSTYSVDTTGHYENNTATLTMQFPSLTPAGSGELYAGYNSNNSSGVYTAPTTSGYTPDVTSDQDVILVDPGVSASTQSPSTTATSQPSTQSSIGVLIVATPASQYTVTFNGNGSTGGSMANETASAPTALTPNAFTRSGYNFAGWNTSSTGSGTSYANDASYPFNASTTLYAQWTPSTGSSIALVAGSTSSTKTGSTGALTVTSAQNVASSANVLLVMVQVFGPNSSGVGTISDTGTGTWTALGETTVSGNSQFVLWQCTNPQAGVKHVVTWTPSSADNWGSLAVMAEWTGGPFTLDQISSVLTSNGTTEATPSVTPSSAGELVLASAADENGTSTWTSPTNGFASLTTPDSANVMAYLVDSATSSISTSWSVSPPDSGVTAIFTLS